MSFFHVDARTILALGRQSIKDSSTAVLELVKNSYDADASRVVVHFQSSNGTSSIIVKDDGHGMTEDALRANWLRIGYSFKRAARTTSAGRVAVGEKGVGRLSADRLGSRLRMISKAQGEAPVLLQLDWDDFDVDGIDVSEVPVVLRRGVQFPSSSGFSVTNGTHIEISNLRDEWSEAMLVDLREDLGTLLTPFGDMPQTFHITLKSDMYPQVNGGVDPPVLAAAPIELFARFEYPELHCDLVQRNTITGVDDQTSRRVSWNQIIQHEGLDPQRWSRAAESIGSFTVHLRFYPRTREYSALSGMRISDFRRVLDLHHGVRVYRDGFSVKPYGMPGHPEGDWLGLAERKTREPAGAGRPTFRVSVNQLLGGVFISRLANPSMADVTSREGLVATPIYRFLKSVVLGCVRIVETAYHQLFVQQNSSRAAPIALVSAEEAASQLKTSVSSLERLVLESVDRVSTGTQDPRTKVALLDLKADLNEEFKTVHASTNAVVEMASEIAVSRSMATIGIASAMFGHEVQSAVGQLRGSSVLMSKALGRNNPDLALIRQEARKIGPYVDRISMWGAFALDRVRRDKRTRTNINVGQIVGSLLRHLQPSLTDVGIHSSFFSTGDTSMRGFAIDVESIFVNLCMNARAACLMINERREIHVRVDRDAIGTIHVLVEDSGPGIPEEHREAIWEPLWTTRVDDKGNAIGTGLGLYLVAAIARDYGALVRAESSEAYGGAAVSVQFPTQERGSDANHSAN